MVFIVLRIDPQIDWVCRFYPDIAELLLLRIKIAYPKLIQMPSPTAGS